MASTDYDQNDNAYKPNQGAEKVEAEQKQEAQDQDAHVQEYRRKKEQEAQEKREFEEDLAKSKRTAQLERENEIKQRQQEARDLRSQKRDEQIKAESARKKREAEDREADRSSEAAHKSFREQREKREAQKEKESYYKDTPASGLLIDKLKGKDEPWKKKLSQPPKTTPTDFWGALAYKGTEHVKKHVENSWNDVWKVPMGQKDASGKPLKKSQELSWMDAPRKNIKLPKQKGFLDIGGFADPNPFIFGKPKPAPRRTRTVRSRRTTRAAPAPKKTRSILDDMLYF